MLPHQRRSIYFECVCVFFNKLKEKKEQAMFQDKTEAFVSHLRQFSVLFLGRGIDIMLQKYINLRGYRGTTRRVLCEKRNAG